MTGPGEESSLTYASAVEELESILAELDDDSVDVDLLAQRVARAATLIRLCRQRIAATRLEVERIVTELDEPPRSPSVGSG